MEHPAGRGPDRELARIDFGPDDLEELRGAIERVVAEFVPATQVSELVLAVHEVALNSVLHGAGRGHVRVIHTGPELVFDIRDRDGSPTSPTVLAPTADSTHGRGLWIASHLSDGIAITAIPDQTSVRLSVLLPATD